MLFSATLDRNVDRLVRRYLHDPVVHSVDPSAGAVTTMEHHVLHVDDEDKHATTTRDRRPRRPRDHVPGHQARGGPAGQAAAGGRRARRRAARRQVAVAAHPDAGPVQGRPRHRAGRDQRRGPRHPRRRPRPRRQRRPAGRPQGLSAPRRPHGPRRRVRHRRHPGAAAPAAGDDPSDGRRRDHPADDAGAGRGPGGASWSRITGAREPSGVPVVLPAPAAPEERRRGSAPRRGRRGGTGRGRPSPGAGSGSGSGARGGGRRG